MNIIKITSALTLDFYWWVANQELMQSIRNGQYS